MHIVSRIKLPKSAEVTSLYLQCNEGASINYSDTPEIVFCQGGKVSTNSYFNSFYENFYAKYTNLDSLYYWLRLEGDFEISIYREVNEQTNRELIYNQKLESCQEADFVEVKLPDSNNGRIYFEILCLSDGGVFNEGLIVGEQNPTQEVSLAIISCTYKKEAYIKKTVNAIAQDQLLQTKSWKIFVVDNGQTLTASDFPDSRVQFIPSRNVGGSGGFTRGLVEALQGSYTHFLFMDDDIELESESIYRLFALYEYAKDDFAIAGSMLDLYKKNVLYEAGALYGKDNQTREPAPFSVAVLKHNLELQNPNSLNDLLMEEEIDYGGFWFFAFSRKVVEKIGLPLPFFIKVDDMEFGLRIKKALGAKIVAFPSIGVWHEPFYNKVIIWDSYYYTRNNLITQTINGTLGYINTIVKFTKELIFSLLVFEYSYAEMMVKAFEDYVKGPSIIKSNNPEVLHKEVLALSKSYKTQSLQLNYSPSEQEEQNNSRAGIGKKLLSLLTLNGHLLPNFIPSDGQVFLWQNSAHAGVRSRAFRKKKVLLFKEENSCLFQNEIDKRVGIKLLARWVKVVATSGFKWSTLLREWKSAYSELTSTMFWQKYLNIEKSN
jgi:galactofuranosylgalactofuranosylrhamnosyl-N-acetylglucosaminyl-diphospho-decaprenol beta-1,5/1,6-galactofuranosyltransferase